MGLLYGYVDYVFYSVMFERNVDLVQILQFDIRNQLMKLSDYCESLYN